MSRVSANETTNKKPAVPTVKKTVDLDQDDNKENDTTAVTMVDEGIMEKNEVNGGTTITSDTPTTGTKGIPRYSEIRGKFSNLLGFAKNYVTSILLMSLDSSLFNVVFIYLLFRLRY